MRKNKMYWYLNSGMMFNPPKVSTNPPTNPPVLRAPVRVSGAALSNNLVEGQQLTIAVPAVYSGNPTPDVTYRLQSRVPPNGALTTHIPGNASITFMLTSGHVGRQFRIQDRGVNSQGSTAWTGTTWFGPVEAAPTGPA